MGKISCKKQPIFKITKNQRFYHENVCIKQSEVLNVKAHSAKTRDDDERVRAAKTLDTLKKVW